MASPAPTTAGRRPRDRPPIPDFKSPRYAYIHASGVCAITGGAFYSPLTNQFPSDYVNDYFFADYCAGWIRKLDPAAGNTVTTFATGISSPVDLKVADDGSLYYLARGDGAVYRVQYGATGPTITSHPTSQTRRARRVGDLQRAGVRPASAAVSVAAQRRQHSGSDRAGLYDRVGRRCRQRRALPGECQQRLRYERRAQQPGHADRQLEPGADGNDLATGRGHLV